MRLPDVVYRKMVKKVAFPLLNRLLGNAGTHLYHYAPESDRLYPLTTFNADIYRFLRTGELDTDRWQGLVAQVPPGGTILDVGANVGYTAAWFAASADRVHAFEPHPANVELLREQLKIRGIENVEVHPMALGDREGTADLHCKPRRGQHSLADIGAHPTQGVLRVPCSTLDAFLQTEGIDAVHLMKLDVEGFEPEVIRGGRSAFQAGAVRRLVFEFSPDLYRERGIDPLAPIDVLAECGYRLSFPDGTPVDANTVRAEGQCDLVAVAPGVTWAETKPA